MGILPCFSPGTWLLILFLALLVVYGFWPYNYFKKLGIPGPTPLPFLGTFLEYRKGLLVFDQECRQRYGKIWGIFDGRQPILAIMDPTIIKSILIKRFYTHFTNRRDFGLNGELDTAITIAKDDQWKRIRMVLSPTFTSGRLKEMFPIIANYGNILVQNAQKKMDNNEAIDMKDILGAYSMDVVASTSFSIDVDSLNNPDEPSVKHLKALTNFNFLNPLLLLLVIFPFLKPLFSQMKVTLMPKAFMNFFGDAVRKIKRERQENNHTDRVDFLKLMLDSQMSGDILDGKNSYKALSDREITAQAIIFIFAGYEPTSSALSFLSYCLATHPDVQQKLQDEIDETVPYQTLPTYDAIAQMEYLDMAVNESLRLYPPGGRIERVCKDTVKIDGVTIPKGTVAMIPVFVLHRDAEFWPEPEEYRPERFSKENRQNIDPYVFLPFGVGPRNCIAMRFALLVIKVAIVVMLQKYSLRVCQETPIPMELDSKGFMKPKKPIKLRLVPRAPVNPVE